MVVALSPLPRSPEGFYAINNQFLENGPKGYSEHKILENEDIFVRIDFPGVPKDGVNLSLHPNKKTVVIFAKAPKDHKHDSSHRSYGTSTGVLCGCCEISGYTSHISDSVLRLVISKTQSPCISLLGGPNQQGRRCMDPYDPVLTGPEIQRHPNVIQGSEIAYEWKKLQNGGLYVRLDMPGVPKDNFTISIEDRRVKVTGQAPAVSHDSAPRFYSGYVARLDTAVSNSGRRIKTIAKNGVIHLTIPPI